MRVAFLCVLGNCLPINALPDLCDPGHVGGHKCPNRGPCPPGCGQLIDVLTRPGSDGNVQLTMWGGLELRNAHVKVNTKTTHPKKRRAVFQVHTSTQNIAFLRGALPEFQARWWCSAKDHVCLPTPENQLTANQRRSCPRIWIYPEHNIGSITVGVLLCNNPCDGWKKTKQVPKCFGKILVTAEPVVVQKEIMDEPPVLCGIARGGNFALNQNEVMLPVIATLARLNVVPIVIAANAYFALPLAKLGAIVVKHCGDWIVDGPHNITQRLFIGFDITTDVYRASVDGALAGAALRPAMNTYRQLLAPVLNDKHAPTTTPTLLWMMRSRRRKLTEPHILLAAAKDAGLEPTGINAGKLNKADLHAAFAAADVIFGVHGADFGNLLLVPPATPQKHKVVVQLLNCGHPNINYLKTDSAPQFYGAWAVALGHTYLQFFEDTLLSNCSSTGHRVTPGNVGHAANITPRLAPFVEMFTAAVRLLDHQTPTNFPYLFWRGA